MILTFADDFTSNVNLDSELMGISESGLFWNRGTIVTVQNLLTFLPKLSITIAAYNAGTTYNKFSVTRNKTDIVTHDSKIWQSISTGHSGQTPADGSAYWLETNEDSIRIKAFLFSVDDNVLSALSLNRKLIENQYIYNVNSYQQLVTLSDDYAGWAYEPKGSDYVKIRINQISLQANTTDQQNLYVINQGQLITTLTLNPNNGILSFEDVDYTFSGKGRFLFIIDSQEVLSDRAYNDPLKYKGFVCYPVYGTGSTPQSANYNNSNLGNGLNFNVSCYLDSSIYIENNKVDLAKFYQAQFEYDYAKMRVNNPHGRFNQQERMQKSDFNLDLAIAEVMDLKAATVAKNYYYQKRQAIDSINNTFDKFLHKKKGIRVKRTVF